MHPLDDPESEPQEVVHIANPREANQIHQVIGEALELFSRHLRGHRNLFPTPPTHPLQG